MIMKRATLISIFVVGVISASLAAFQSSAAVRVLREGTIWAARPIFRLGELAAAFLGRGGSEFESRIPSDDARVQALLFEREALLQENNHFRTALATAERAGLALRAADVIRYGRDPSGEFLIVAAGQNHGLASGDAAVDEQGAVVGFVVQVGQNVSRISVASNRSQAHDVLLLPGGARALARGLGGRTFMLDFIPLDTPVRVGDYAALAGRDLERALPLGRISAVNPGGNSAFQDVRAVLVVDPSRLRTVFVAESRERR